MVCFIFMFLSSYLQFLIFCYYVLDFCFVLFLTFFRLIVDLCLAIVQFLQTRKVVFYFIVILEYETILVKCQLKMSKRNKVPRLEFSIYLLESLG